jgi:TnpA family transposase
MTKLSGKSNKLLQDYILSSDEIDLINVKSRKTRVYFAYCYKFYQNNKRLPEKGEFRKQAINQLAVQLSTTDNIINGKFTELPIDRTKQRLFSQIRGALSLKIIDNDSYARIKQWLIKDILPFEYNNSIINEELKKYFDDNNYEYLSPFEIKKLVNSAFYIFEQDFFASINQKLSEEFKELIESWLKSHDNQNNSFDNDNFISLKELKKNPGTIGVNSAFEEINKLLLINKFNLPDGILDNLAPKIIKRFYHRSTSQGLWEFRKQKDKIKYPLLAIFLTVKRQTIIDHIIELLIRITHKIKVNSEKKVKKGLLDNIKKISNKEQILFDVAVTAKINRDSNIEEKIFPAFGGEQKLDDLIKDLQSEKRYVEKVHVITRSSYSHHYRKVIIEILNLFDFKSNNELHQPIIKAISIIKKYATSNIKYFPEDEVVPIDTIISKNSLNLVREEKADENKAKNNIFRINRINYEIFVLQSLREKLLCGEIWIDGAKRFQNPQKNLPQDFSERKSEYFELLNIPENVKEFRRIIEKELSNSLLLLNKNIPTNKKVEILKKNSGWIKLTPLDAQEIPPNLKQIKKELFRKWPMTSLLDVIKEVFLRTSCIKHFKSVATSERIDPEILQKRLVLAIYGIGTNTGLKRVTAGNQNENYKNLDHILQNYITKDNLKFAIAEIVNKTFRIRNPNIWGESTTSCASDSKQFGSWDQNLMTEWHNRYHGRGIMIYWHVEKGSICINSQLKRCSSSEVSSMMQGVIHHCTEMEVEKNYVDTHGQSAVAFAFSHLLGFKLLPRLKDIYKQKLYLPNTNLRSELSNLQPIIAQKSINWELFETQYEEIAKYAIALKSGIADAEDILKIFTKNNRKHPTYLALIELGKAVKTIFLCNYLIYEELRQEIQEGLNVVENWNSANDFILFGKGGELATNNFDLQELIALCLHFIQNSLAYINTLMIQEILKQQHLLKLMTKADFRGLNPLLYDHVTPYGSFSLDMNERIKGIT